MIGHLELAIGMLFAYITCIMGMAYKNLMVSRHDVRFFSDASEQI